MGEREISRMIFRLPFGDVEITTPEELGQSKIGVHPNVVDRQWGKGAGDRYLRAMGFNPNGTPEIGGQNG